MAKRMQRAANRAAGITEPDEPDEPETFDADAEFPQTESEQFRTT